MTEVDYQLAILLQHKFEQENKDSQLAKTLQEQEELEARQKAVATKSNLDDSLLAKSLQDQFQAELALERPGQNLVYAGTRNPLNSSKCLTDPSWEVIDPTPDIHNLFIVFNERFFWNKLGSVCVDWSKRMTTCAGICSYQGRGGMCTISLSEPLLKLRPRKDLVETLLHEMIHAYLFVTHNNRDRDGHGPEFHKHMKRINDEAGTNITVYHDFHDEVRLYQQHWWKCNGPCQKWKPYFGMVRRAMNRKPGPYDRWWAEHAQKCGGEFVKVKEPEKTEKPAKTKPVPDAVSKTPDIRTFYPTHNSDKKVPGDNIKTIPKNSSNSGVDKVISNSNNIHGFTNLSTDSNNKPKGGTSLKNSSSTIVITKKPTKNTKDDKTSTQDSNRKNRTKSVPAGTLGQKDSDIPDYSVIRNHWLNKFSNATNSTSSISENSNTTLDNSTKSRKRVNFDPPAESSPKTPKISESLVECPLCSKKLSEHQINAHLDECLEKEESKDCPLCGTSVVAQHFNEHLKNCATEFSNDVFDDDNAPKDATENDKKCDVCQELVPANSYYEHIDRCLHGMFDRIEENLVNTESKKGDECDDEVECLACNKKILKSQLSEHLEDCMNLSNIFDSENEPSEAVSREVMMFNCPACMKLVSESEMNGHIDACLNIVVIDE